MPVEGSLAVNVIHDLICFTTTMFYYQIILYPCNEMIFESSFDYLMKEITPQEPMNISTWKVIRERPEILSL